MTAQEAVEALKAGNSRYTADNLMHPHSDNSRKQSLTGSQKPFAIILSCADSRVVPELVFDQGIGDIFVIRVAGNTANASSIASIEYAVANLGTKLVVVLGHESCGACQAAITTGGEGLGPNLGHLLGMINPAVAASESKDVNDVVEINAHMQAQNLVKKSDIIKDGVDSQGVEIVSAFYHLGSGAVDFL